MSNPNTNSIQEFLDAPELFKELELEQQLSLVADLSLACSDHETDALEVKDKFTAKRWHDRAKYWQAQNQNIKKLAELEVSARRLG